MKFVKSNKKLFYEQWKCHDKLNDCIFYIYRIEKAKNYENGIYHFTVIGKDFTFSSLTNEMVYQDYYECEVAVYRWRIINFNKKEKKN